MPHVSKAVHLEPLPFQEADLAQLAAHDYSGFIVAETGAGKTLIGIEAARRSPAQRILIIAVKSTVQDTWVDQIKAQDPGADVRVIDGTPEGKLSHERLELGYAGYYIVTHQKFTLSDWSLCEPHMVIADEAHLFSNRDAKGTHKLLDLGKRTRRRIVMSGTMVRNRFENFYPLLRFVYPERNGAHDISDISSNRWIRDWCEWEEDHFSPNGMKVIGEKNPGALAAAIPCYVQHFKREHCCEFHPHGFLDELEAPVSFTSEVDLTRRQKLMIDQMESDYVAWLADQADTRQLHVVKLPVTVRLRLRQMTLGVPRIVPGVGYQTYKDGTLKLHPVTQEPIPVLDEVYFDEDCQSPKIDRLGDILLGQDGQKLLGENAETEHVLVLTSSRKIIAPVLAQLRALGIAAVEWSGGVSSTQRAEIKEKFIAQNPSVRVIVAVVSSIGTGTDGLQFATNNLIWLERSDDLSNNVQAEGRLDRRGQTRQVRNIEIIARGSMDEGIISDQITKRLALNKSLRKATLKAKRETELSHG